MTRLFLLVTLILITPALHAVTFSTDLKKDSDEKQTYPTYHSAHDAARKEEVPCKEKELGHRSDEECYLELDTVLEWAFTENPALRAARDKWKAALSHIPQARSLEDPQLKYGIFGQEVQTRVGPMEHKFGVMQQFPFYGKRGLKGEMAEKEAEMASERFRATWWKIRTQVKKSYYELFWIHKAIAINEENVTLLRRLEKVAEIKYETGKVSQQDVLKAQVELSKLADELITLEELRETVIAQLNTLLDRNPNAPLAKPQDVNITKLDYTLDQLYHLARLSRPELQETKAAIAKSKAAYELARKQYFPDLTIGVDYTVVGEGDLEIPDAGEDAWMLLAGINLPIWYGKLDAGVQEANKRLKATQNGYENMENSTLFEVKDYHFRIDTSRRLVNLYATSILPQAEQSLKAAEIGYEAGKVDFLNLIDSQRTLLNFQLAYYRSLTDHEQHIANLERAVGAEIAGGKNE